MTPQEFREKRRASNLTIDQLARYLGLTNGQVRSIERGSRSPRIQDITTLLKLYETACPASYSSVGEERQVPSESDGTLYFDSQENTQQSNCKRRFNSFGFSLLRGGADRVEGNTERNEEI